MRVYHYTAVRFLDSIRHRGLTRGAVLVSANPLRVNHEYRWLTMNPSWNQEWAKGTGRLPYKTNEARLDIDIPSSEEYRLLKWTEVGRLLSRECDILNSFGDPDNWRLWRGDVPPAWITRWDINPAYSASLRAPASKEHP